MKRLGQMKRYWVLLSLLALTLGACRAQQTAEMTPATQQPVSPTATDLPAPNAALEEAAFTDPDPASFVSLIPQDPTTLDPALAYDLNSGVVLENVLEGLIAFHPSDSNRLIPVLATTVPDESNGLITNDGLTYTFPIRQGVTFQDGATMTPEDVAYSIQRGLLQSDPTGPQWLLIDPIMGYGSGDITEEIAEGAYAADPEGLRANASPEDLLAVCEKVKAAVAADEEAGTVTINLSRPWGPFLPTVAGFIRVIDKEWAAANGDWDGDCATWQNHYAPGQEGSPLGGIINGTGPYRLESWARGEEFVLTAFDDYWRTDGTPLYEGGPAGAAQIPTAIYRVSPEWGTRLAALQVGDADYVMVPDENESQVDPLVGEVCDYLTGLCSPVADNPDGFLRKWADLPSVNRADIFLNFNISADSPFIGSGALDGNGIPPEFFSDINVRRAFATCFDYDTYIDEVQAGKGRRNNGPIIWGLLGYNEEGAQYEYDPEACAAHLAEAWGGVLPETGFRFTFVYPEGLPGGSSAAAILQSGLAAVNEKYQIEPLGQPFPLFFGGFESGQIPASFSGWFEDVHDPHFWAQPYTIGSYGAFQNIPESLQAKFAELVQTGIASSDPAEREPVYFELQRLFHEEVPTIILAQRSNFRFEPRWVNGFQYREGIDHNNPPLYLLSLAGE